MWQAEGERYLILEKADIQNLPPFFQVYHLIPQSTVAGNCTILGAPPIAMQKV